MQLARIVLFIFMLDCYHYIILSFNCFSHLKVRACYATHKQIWINICWPLWKTQHLWRQSIWTALCHPPIIKCWVDYWRSSVSEPKCIHDLLSSGICFTSNSLKRNFGPSQIIYLLSTACCLSFQFPSARQEPQKVKKRLRNTFHWMDYS